ncbi:MAG: glycine cleavage system protein GcvH [Candidatus Hodarchaeales archaeon]|jgi:glycine cleavage system H protein
MSYKVLPEFKYLPEHDWAKRDGEYVLVGVTDFAQKTLKDVVYIELPEVGETFNFKAVIGSIESVKAVAELVSPISGEVIEVNEEAVDAPEKVNQAPYETWLVKIKPSDLETDWNKLMTPEEYTIHCTED